MRTKNLNLKKKIAFIASVAMIATTAAYLPNEVTKNIFSNSIVADAADVQVDLVNAYVKVNGKYLAINENGETKYFNTINAVKNDTGYEVDDLANLKGLFANDADASWSKAAKTYDGYECFGVGEEKVFPLPADVPANAEITVSFELDDAKTITKNGYFDGGTSEYSVTLDDKGSAEFKKSKKVVAVGNDAVLDNDNKYKAGTIEYFDLEGLKFRVKPSADAVVTKKEEGEVTAQGIEALAGDMVKWSVGGLALDGKEAIDADATELKKVTVGGKSVYATVLSGQLDPSYTKGEETVKLKKGTAIKAEFTTSSSWKSSGDPTFTLDKNGLATSSVVTFTSTSGEQQNFIFKFEIDKTGVNDLMAGLKIKEGSGDGEGVALNTLGVGEEKKSNMMVYPTLEANNKGEFENVYYIYTTKNDTNANVDYTVTASAEDKGLYDTEKGSADETASTNNKVTIDKADTEGTIDTLYLRAKNAQTGDAVKFVISSEYKLPVEYNDGENNKEYRAYDTSVSNGKNFRGWSLEDADDEAAVVGTKITRPATTPTRPGYTFEGWYVGTFNSENDGNALADGFTKAFGSSSSTQQNANAVNPYVGIVANWKANKYKVVLDSNGGFFNEANYTEDNKYGGGVGTAYEVDKYDGDDKSTVLSVETNASIDSELAASDIDKLAKPTRWGYEFKGWGLTATADKADALDADSYEDNEPETENGTYKLYAIWEAVENSVEFKEITTENGVKVGDDEYFTDTVADVTTSGIKVDTGDKISALPEAVKTGYTFVGWYRKTVSSTGKVGTAAVTTSTPILYDYLDDAVNDNGVVTDGAVGNKKITLYAKFEKNSYTITYDLDGGEWPSEDVEKAAPTSFDTAIDDKAAQYEEGKLVSGASWAELYNILNCTKDAETQGEAGETVSNAPQKGTGAYYKFTGWTINGAKSKKYTDAETLAKALAKEDGNVTLTATYDESENASGGSIYLDLQDGKYWAVDSKGKYFNITRTAGEGGDIYKMLDEAPLIKGDSNGKITEKIDGAKIYDTKGTKAGAIDVAITQKDFIVVRPGYEFTGWYSDKECTKPYTFSTYPDDTEITVYAGWKALNTTRYTLVYNLVDEDGSLVNIAETVGDKVNYGTDGNKTYMGVTGETATAEDKVITYEGKKYYFDAVKSKGMKTKEEITAAYKNVSSDEAVSSFEYDNTQYAKIYGVFAEEPSTAELGKATNVKVSDKGAVTFTAADNAVKYQVCKIVDGKKYYSAKTDATTINITPAKKDYQVYVIAFDENGKSTHSATVKVTVKATSTLGTVQNPKVTESLEGDKKIGTVTWDAVEGATWYKVFKVVNGKTYWGSKVTENKYVFKDLPKDSSYIIYVAAGDDKGNVTYGARTKISKYPAVQNVKISADKKTVTFDKAEGAVNYQVAKLINGKTYYGTKSESNSITLQSAAKSGTQIFVLAFFTGEDGKTYSSYSQSITVE